VGLLLKVAGSKLEPLYVTSGGGIKASAGADMDFSRAKIEKMIGWKPEVDLEDGLRRLIAWRKTVA
jgi:UDP-glucose 4-epimerase